MNLRTWPLALAFSGALAFSAWASGPMSDYRNDVIYAPPPQYPQLARETHLEGEGIFEAKFSPETGAITKVVILQSTGYKILDAAAVGAIRHWRAKPHLAESIRIPIHFVLSGRVEAQLRNARTHAVYSPAPVYPYSLYRYRVHSGGRYQLTINPQTGLVADVKILAGSRVLPMDCSCVDTFQRWRFVPHTVTTVTIDYSF